MFIENFLGAFPLSDRPQVGVYKENGNLFYEINLAGLSREDIKLYKTSRGMDVEVNPPTYPLRTYTSQATKPTPGRISLIFSTAFVYDSVNLDKGILTIKLKSAEESDEIKW
jgi:HSP20 family molecular chaperone IbpA